jgi:hypothetical protein
MKRHVVWNWNHGAWIDDAGVAHVWLPEAKAWYSAPFYVRPLLYFSY